jgi:hypothetical protein
MKQTLEELLSSYLVNVDLEAISDNRFRCLVDLYRDLNKEHPTQQEEGVDTELDAFIKALQDSDI